MNKKIKNSILFVGIILLGYLNYYKEEDGFGIIDNVIETTNVVYDTSGYHIEAEKQIDDMDLDTTKFRKATAKYENMTLSGDKVFLDAGKNIFLEENIVGNNGEGWEMFSDALSYNQYKDLLTSDKGMKAVNKEEGITLEGKEVVTNKNFDNVDISKNVTMSNEKVKIQGDTGKYQKNKNLFTVNGNGKFESLEENGFKGEFNQGKYFLNKDTVEFRKGYTGYFQDAVIKGKNLDYNNKKQTFITRNNPVIYVDGYTINSQEIKKTRPENEIDIVGQINGTNGDISFRGNYGIYKIDEKILYLDGDVEITNSKGEKLRGELARYNFETKVADFSNKNKNVEYSFQDRKAYSKKLVYDFNKENLVLNDGYTFEDSKYRSVGKNMEYDNTSKIGNIKDGQILVKATKELIKADDINFDTIKKDYKAFGNVNVERENDILTTDQIEYLTSMDKGNIPNEFVIKNKLDGSLTKGRNLVYTISKNQITTEEIFTYENKNSYVSGKGMVYDLGTEIGNLLSEVKYEDRKNNSVVTGDKGEFKKDTYLSLKENVKLVTKSEELLTTEANYDFKTDVVNLPNQIDFRNLDDSFVGKLEKGKILNSKKLFVGQKFSGVSSKKENIISDVFEYGLDTKFVKLRNNINITNEDSKIKANEVLYDNKKNTIFAVGNLKIDYQSNINMTGENILLNTLTKDISGEKVFMKTDKNENISSDKFRGNLDKMTFNFLRNVKGSFVTKTEDSSLPTKLIGNDITITMLKDKNSNKVHRVIGKKGTIITRGTQSIKSDDIIYNFLKGTVVANRNNKIYSEDEENKVTILGDKIEGNMNEEKLYFNSKVTMENINNKNEKTTLVGDKGVLDNNAQTVQLTGNVKMENEQFIFNADRMIYNKNTQKVKAYGNTKIDYKIK